MVCDQKTIIRENNLHADTMLRNVDKRRMYITGASRNKTFKRSPLVNELGKEKY